MGIFDAIWHAIVTVLPFLAKAAEKTFNDLDEAVQQNGIDGSLFAQIIKENVDAAEIDVNNLIKDKLKINDDQLQTLLAGIRAQYNIPTALSVTTFLQHQFIEASKEILHSSKANELAAIASIVLSKGKLTWVSLMMGLGEYFYRRFVKAKTSNLKLDTVETTPKQQCQKLHGGEAGYCDDAGVFHPAE